MSKPKSQLPDTKLIWKYMARDKIQLATLLAACEQWNMAHPALLEVIGKHVAKHLEAERIEAVSEFEKKNE